MDSARMIRKLTISQGMAPVYMPGRICPHVPILRFGVRVYKLCLLPRSPPAVAVSPTRKPPPIRIISPLVVSAASTASARS
eukprot:2956707-Pyramimonas_sp.AAC.1